MFRNSRFVPYAVHVVGSAMWINQVSGHPINAGVSMFEETTGSQTDRAFVATRSISPTVPITTTDLTCLGTIGFNGVAWNGTTAVPVVLYARELPLGGVPSPVASSVHMQFSISDGLMVPMSITCGHNQAAQLNLMIHALLGSGGSSGATPIVCTVGQSISQSGSPEPGTNNVYTTGPIHFTTGASSPAISPRLLQGITQLHVDLGVGAIKESTDGDVYDAFAAIPTRMPRFEFTTRDLNLLYEIGDGIAISAFDLYFRNLSTNGQRVAPGTATHLKVSGTTGMLHPGSTNLRHKSAGEASFTYTPAAASPVISISSSASIPTTP